MAIYGMRVALAATLAVAGTIGASADQLWDGVWGSPSSNITISGQNVQYLIAGKSGAGANVQVGPDTVSFDAGKMQVTIDRLNDHAVSVNLQETPTHARTLVLCRIEARMPNGRTATGGRNTCP